VEAILSQVFTEAQMGKLVRVVLDQAASTPGMIVGEAAREEVKTLFAGIARAVSASERNLLSGDDWLEVAAIIAEQTAKNPRALFKIEGTDIEDEFAVRLVTDLLKAAAADFRTRGRSGGSVLFGETLQTVIKDTVRAVTENVAQAAQNQDHLIAFVERLNGLQSAGFGSDAWLRMFRAYYKVILFAPDGAAALADIPDDELRALIGRTD
jgi:hypothetical protein